LIVCRNSVRDDGICNYWRVLNFVYMYPKGVIDRALYKNVILVRQMMRNRAWNDWLDCKCKP